MFQLHLVYSITGFSPALYYGHFSVKVQSAVSDIYTVNATLIVIDGNICDIIYVNTIICFQYQYSETL